MMRSRPAESGGVVGAVAFLICYFVGVHDAGVLIALGVVLGFVPAAITWVVNLFRPSSAPAASVK